MATTAKSVVRREMARSTGDYFLGETTSTGDSTSVIDTSLQIFPGGGDDDFCLGWFVLITESDHSAVDEIRRVSAYTNGTSDITVAAAFSATVGSSTAYELYRYNPTDYNNAIFRASSMVYPNLYRWIVDESIVVDNLLLNADFETFASSLFTNWTAVGSPTLTQETSIVIHGTNAAKVVVAGGADDQLTQTIDFPISEIAGKTLVFKCWVWATVASKGRIRVDWDGTNFESHAFHSGVDQWELQTISVTVPETATQVKAVLDAADGSTVYFDAASLAIDPVYRYTVTSDIVDMPYALSQQYSESDPSGQYFPLTISPTAHRRLRVEGMGLISQPTTDSGTIEVGEPQLELFIAAANHWLYRVLASRSATRNRDRFKEEAKDWNDQFESLKRTKSMPAMGAQVQGMGLQASQWHFEGNKGDWEVVLSRTRGGAAGLGFSRLF